MDLRAIVDRRLTLLRPQALRFGFRLVDSAQADEWYNEADAGRAIQQYLEESGGSVTRDDLWITTKVAHEERGRMWTLS